jgi:hypothetical protein
MGQKAASVRMVIAASIALVIAAPTIAQGQTSAIPVVRNAADLCRLREVEMIRLNTTMLQRGAALSAEKNPQKQAPLIAAYQAASNVIQSVEAQWQRMGCATILYGDRSAFGR